ncbi:Acetylornithine deacetylase [hydrothermal vent metagenome]|uniref:Acetylornithine deacetylase n=1 Tax=hydrothermal vent metagenome TaxID=652676 RepID=A0A3B0SCM1_9ZZZZ
MVIDRRFLTEEDIAQVEAEIRATLERVRAPDYVVSPGTYDQKHIDRIGRLKNCIAYGPGILDLAHKPDEYVGIKDMVQSAQVMALALRDLPGVAREAPARGSEMRPGRGGYDIAVRRAIIRVVRFAIYCALVRLPFSSNSSIAPATRTAGPGRRCA